LVTNDPPHQGVLDYPGDADSKSKFNKALNDAVTEFEDIRWTLEEIDDVCLVDDD
jgi:hypothetical protein